MILTIVLGVIGLAFVISLVYGRPATRFEMTLMDERTHPEPKRENE